jgi:hypothetical protein
MSSRSSSWRELIVRLAAELGVIVLGVLIALWADGWVAERADRNVERARTDALRENIVATRLRLDEAVEEARSAQEALSTMAYWEDAALLNRQQDLLLRGLLFGPVFTPEINVYIDLKNSGDLALLTSADLRQALARMDAVLEQLALLQSDVVAVQQLNFDPFVVRELALEGTLGPLLGLEDLPTVASTPDVDMQVLRNLALFKLDLIAQLLRQYEEAGETLQGVEGAIEEIG